MMWQRPNKGISLFEVLITLALFSSLFFAFNRWTTSQRQSAVKIYQDIQALQIAENQAQRQILGLGCELQVRQNTSVFNVRCQNNQVIVRSPQGEISIKIE